MWPIAVSSPYIHERIYTIVGLSETKLITLVENCSGYKSLHTPDRLSVMLARGIISTCMREDYTNILISYK